MNIFYDSLLFQLGPATALGRNEAIIAESAGELLAPPPVVKLPDAGGRGRSPTVWWTTKKAHYAILVATTKDDGFSKYCIHETPPESVLHRIYPVVPETVYFIS